MLGSRAKARSRSQKKSHAAVRSTSSSHFGESTAKYAKNLGDLTHEAVERDREINGEDEDYTPSVDHSIYYHSYDHYNYGQADANAAMSEVKIKGHHLKRGGGRLCQPYDWVTVHWKSYLKDGGEQMEDSRKYLKGHPMVFHLGHFQSVKCWELAIVSMQAGEVVDMDCPHYYAYGGTEKWSHFGAKKIAPYSDLEFKLEVLECEPSIDALNQANLMADNKAPAIEK